MSSQITPGHGKFQESREKDSGKLKRNGKKKGEKLSIEPLSPFKSSTKARDREKKSCIERGRKGKGRRQTRNSWTNRRGQQGRKFFEMKKRCSNQNDSQKKKVGKRSGEIC